MLICILRTGDADKPSARLQNQPVTPTLELWLATSWDVSSLYITNKVLQEWEGVSLTSAGLFWS